MAGLVLVRSDIEILGYLARARQKRTERELAEALKPLDDIADDQVRRHHAPSSIFPKPVKSKASPPPASRSLPYLSRAQPPWQSREEVNAAVGGALDRLRALKRRVSDAIDKEEGHHKSTRARIVRVCPGTEGEAAGTAAPVDGEKASPSSAASGKLALLDDLLIDYMLRQDLDDVALDLATEGGRGEHAIPPSHAELKQLLTALRAQDTAPALEWCTVHRNKLKKLGSPLEALLHLRTFASHVTGQELAAAVAYARAHFPALYAEHPELVRSAMGALAVPPKKQASHEFFSEGRWLDVAGHLRSAHRALTAAPATSPLVLTLWSGLSVLRTPKCESHASPPKDGTTLSSPSPPTAPREVPQPTPPTTAVPPVDHEQPSPEEGSGSGNRLPEEEQASSGGGAAVGIQSLVSAWRSLASSVDVHTANAASAAAAAAAAASAAAATAVAATAAAATDASAAAAAAEPPSADAVTAATASAVLDLALARAQWSAIRRNLTAEEVLSARAANVTDESDVTGPVEDGCRGTCTERVLDCPVCSAPYAQLAKALPSVQRSHSSIVCRLSGETTNEDNPPMVLPDGNVYSYRALSALAAADGVFAHPITGELLRLDQLRKAFFL